MIRHPGWLHRLYAAAGQGSIAAWTPPGIPAPGEVVPMADEPEPPLEPWQTDAEHERMVRHWREKRSGKKE